MTSDIIC